MSSQLADIAAMRAVNHPDARERRRLFDGHRMRRQDLEVGGLVVTDHSAADEWLIEQYLAPVN
jgi:hypothetical protein